MNGSNTTTYDNIRCKLRILSGEKSPSISLVDGNKLGRSICEAIYNSDRRLRQSIFDAYCIANMESKRVPFIDVSISIDAEVFRTNEDWRKMRLGIDVPVVTSGESFLIPFAWSWSISD